MVNIPPIYGDDWGMVYYCLNQIILRWKCEVLKVSCYALLRCRWSAEAKSQDREKERILPIEKGNIEQKAGEVRCHQHFAQRELGLPFTNTSCHLSGTTGQWVTQPCGQETHHHDARINFMALYESLGHGKNLRSICPICINLIVLPCSSVLGGSPNWKRQSMKVL